MDHASRVPLRTTSATRIREAETLVYLRQRGDHDRDVQHNHQVANEDDREYELAMGGSAGGGWLGYTALDPALYCSSVTFSIQSTALPSSASRIAMCVIAVVGEAPCQCFSWDSNQ